MDGRSRKIVEVECEACGMCLTAGMCRSGTSSVKSGWSWRAAHEERRRGRGEELKEERTTVSGRAWRLVQWIGRCMVVPTAVDWSVHGGAGGSGLVGAWWCQRLWCAAWRLQALELKWALGDCVKSGELKEAAQQSHELYGTWPRAEASALGPRVAREWRQ